MESINQEFMNRLEEIFIRLFYYMFIIKIIKIFI